MILNNRNILALIASLVILSNCSAIAKRDWGCKAAGNKYGCTSIRNIDDDREKDISKKLQDKTKNLVAMGRSEEKIGRIYIAPYIDSKNHYHEGEYIKFIEQSPDWQTSH